MKWIKGIGLFLIANFLIYITLSVTANLLINFVLPAFGIDVRGVFTPLAIIRRSTTRSCCRSSRV